MHTSSPGVGVVGSSLGGGVSWYARQHGLQCSAITAVELVLADGTFVRATDDPGRRPAVGGPRRQRRLRGRHRAGVRPAAGPHGVRRDAGLGLAARPARAHRVGRVDRGRARVGDQRRPDLPGARRSSGCPADVRGRQLVMIDAVALGDAEAAARVARPAARAAARDRHVRAGARGRHRPPAARPAGAHRGLRQQRPGRRPARRTRSTRWSRPPAPARAATCSSSSCASSAARWRGPPRAAVRSTTCDGAFLVLGVGLDVGTGWSAVREDATADPGLARRRGPPARRTSRWPTRPPPGAAGRPAAYERLVRIRAAADPDGLFVAPQRVRQTTDSAARAQVGASPPQAPGCTFGGSTTTPRPGGSNDHRHRPAPRTPYRSRSWTHSRSAPSRCPATRRTTPSSRRGTSPSRSDPRPSSPRTTPRTSSRPCSFAARHGLRVTPQATGHGPMADLDHRAARHHQGARRGASSTRRAGPASEPA